MSKLSLEVVTPLAQVAKVEADYVNIPGSVGELGILPGHLALLTSLADGDLVYTEGGKENRISVAGGFAEVNSDKVTILANKAEVA